VGRLTYAKTFRKKLLSFIPEGVKIPLNGNVDYEWVKTGCPGHEKMVARKKKVEKMRRKYVKRVDKELDFNIEVDRLIAQNEASTKGLPSERDKKYCNTMRSVEMRQCVTTFQELVDKYGKIWVVNVEVYKSSVKDGGYKSVCE
jgi:hypothetical protein